MSTDHVRTHLGSGIMQPSYRKAGLLGRQADEVRLLTLSGVVITLQPSPTDKRSVDENTKECKRSVCEGLTGRLFPFFSHQMLKLN